MAGMPLGGGAIRGGGESKRESAVGPLIQPQPPRTRRLSEGFFVPETRIPPSFRGVRNFPGIGEAAALFRVD